MGDRPTKSLRRDNEKFMLRLPDGMRERIKEAAEANGRSMNTEIIARMETPAERVTLDAVLDGLYAISRRLEGIEAQIAAPSDARHHHQAIARRGGVFDPMCPPYTGGQP